MLAEGDDVPDLVRLATPMVDDGCLDGVGSSNVSSGVNEDGPSLPTLGLGARLYCLSVSDET